MLVDLKTILSKYKKSDVAVGSFNTPNSATIRAVITAAEELNVPVIIAHAQIHDSVAPLDFIAPIMLACAKNAKVPVCVHLDHGEDEEYVKRAIDLGFSSVMIDCSELDYNENVKISKNIALYAHSKGVNVEAELGKMASREGGTASGNGEYTDSNMVNNFINNTGIDALAIAFGTAHGIYKVAPKLNLDVINAVKKVTNLPLVMHGGSGISNEIYRDVILRGVAKINYYTYMSYDGFAGAKELVLAKDKGFYHDLDYAAYENMKANVVKTLKVFNNL